MGTIVNFVSRLFQSTMVPQHGSTCLNATPHDALRLTAAVGRDEHHRRIDACQRQPGVVRLTYHSDAELLKHLGDLDRPNRSVGLNVVLVLGRRTGCHVRSLIERLHPADRLVIALRDGRLPGLESAGDLALASSRLGWGRIEVDRDCQGAIATARYRHEPGQSLVILEPPTEYLGYL